MGDWFGYLILFGAGCLSGALNVIAGGGSFLTLPILIFLGLPATVANGTNRVGVFCQNIGAVWGFHRHRVMDWRSVFWAAMPSTVGAVFGTWAALWISDQAFKRILALLMVILTLWTFWDPLKGRKSGDQPSANLHVIVLCIGFFVVGVYSGFVQAGVGFLILAVTTMAGLDLVRGNAVKVLSVLTSMVVSLGIFAWQGKVDWPMGSALAAGNLLGGLVGVQLTVLKGHAWIKKVVTVTIIIFAVRLWFSQ